MLKERVMGETWLKFSPNARAIAAALAQTNAEEEERPAPWRKGNEINII